jgi:hypothetical protein
VILVELRPNVHYKLARGGVIALVGEDHVIGTLEDALQLIKKRKSPEPGCVPGEV